MKSYGNRWNFFSQGSCRAEGLYKTHLGIDVQDWEVPRCWTDETGKLTTVRPSGR
jgi:hypothetical protein